MSGADAHLQQRVLEELKWEPSIDAAHIGVAADDHVVTLTGTVPSYYQKVTAERAAERVFGAQAIANDIEVVFPGSHTLSDTDIATAALDGLHRSVSVPKSGVDIGVSGGIITLRGSVEWRYQRDAAERAVRDLAGVVDVVNLISVKPRPSRKLVKQNILNAFQRNAVLDAANRDRDERWHDHPPRHGAIGARAARSRARRLDGAGRLRRRESTGRPRLNCAGGPNGTPRLSRSA
jgi:osmotically-inducible protein OsmY